MCESIEEATTVLQLIWPDQDRRCDDRLIYDLFHLIYILIIFCWPTKSFFCSQFSWIFYCYFTVTFLHWFLSLHPPKEHFLTIVFFILLISAITVLCVFPKIGDIGVFSKLQQCCSINCVQYDSGELGVWVSPIGAHWIDKYALYPILTRCVNAIYMIYSQ